MDVYEYLTKFQLDLISQDWIDSVWKEFPFPFEPPPDYDELNCDIDFCELLSDTSSCMRLWLDNNSRSSLNDSSFNVSIDKSWNNLAAKFNHKSLVCILSAFISQFSSESEDDLQIRAIEAAKLYFVLLAIDGAEVFEIYQPPVFSHAVDILKSVGKLNTQSVARKKQRGRKRKNDEREDETGDDENSAEVLTPSKRRQLVSFLSQLINVLSFSLKKFSLRNDADILSETVYTLVQVTAVEQQDSSLFQARTNPGTTAYIAQQAYGIIEVLCSKFHGNVKDALHSAFVGFLPRLCIHDSSLWHNSSKEIMILKDHSIKFIIQLVRSVKEECYSKVRALVQQLCVRAPDKADVRIKCVQMIVDFLDQLPCELYLSIVKWIISFCFADLVRHRLTGIELVSKIFISRNFEFCGRSSYGSKSSSSRCSEGNSSICSTLSSSFSLSPNFLFGVILNRIRDSSPRVRVKALSILASLINSKEAHVLLSVETMFILPVGVNFEKRDYFDYRQFLLGNKNKKITADDTLPTIDTFWETMDVLLNDEKVFVRKNALLVVSNICLLNHNWITEDRLKILVRRCKDTSVGIRKMLAQCLTNLLLRNPSSELLSESWVIGVLPLLADNEGKTEEKALEAAESVILENIVVYNKMSAPKHTLPWTILGLLTVNDMRKLFKYACQQWAHSNKLTTKLVSTLLTYINTTYNLSVLYFLACISEFQDLPNIKPLLNYFYDKVFNTFQADESTSQVVMRILVLNWKKMDKDDQNELADKLKQSITAFHIPVPLIAGSMELMCLHSLNDMKIWGHHFIMVVEEKINRHLAGSKNLGDGDSNHILARLIFILGEVTLFCPDVVTRSVITKLSNLVDVTTFDESVLQVELKKMGIVHAVTVITLGKLCLQNEIIAKGVVPILGNLVSSPVPKEIKINANCALTDLCIRFSSLVEPYFGDMCVCLKDNNISVRKSILTLLTNLIQEDYLKLKTPVFLYLLSMLRDESNDIRDFASSFMVNSLLAKYPGLMCQHFIPVIFFLNDYEISTYSTDTVSPQEKQAFCLSGHNNTLHRRQLYKFLLEHMQDDKKFKTIHRICTEILDPIAEGKMSVMNKGELILKDSLYVLGCEEIRLNPKRDKEDEGDEEGGVDVEPVAVAKTAFVSQFFSTLVKKNLTENVIPIIIKLKHKLQMLKSPLYKDLMVCLREILRDYKEQVSEMLAADPDLASEVSHDLQTSEAAENTHSQTQEDLTQDTITAELRVIAHRLSETVLRHGGDINTAIHDTGGNSDAENRQSSEESVTDSVASGVRRKAKNKTRTSASRKADVSKTSVVSEQPSSSRRGKKRSHDSSSSSISSLSSLSQTSKESQN